MFFAGSATLPLCPSTIKWVLGFSTTQINDKVVSLRGIEDRLNTCIDYIDSCTPENPPNQEIMNELQSIINVLPTLHVHFVEVL